MPLPISKAAAAWHRGDVLSEVTDCDRFKSAPTSLTYAILKVEVAKMKIGEKITAGRQKLGFTQRELADKLFVTHQTVSQWENDQRKPDLDALARLCQILSLDARDILGVREDDRATMNGLLGTPALAEIGAQIKFRPAYMNAHIAGHDYPKHQTPGWLNHLTAWHQIAVGNADFNAEVTLEDEHGQVFYQQLPERMTVALLQALVFPNTGMLRIPQIRYRTLVTIAGMNLLVPTPTVVPELLKWATEHHVQILDPMQLVKHQGAIDFAALTQVQFEKLAAGTPYAFAYEQSGGSMAPW